MYKVVDLLAPIGVLIAERVEDDAAVNVYIFAEGIVLQCVASVDDRRRYVLLLLSCLFLEERLVVLEILEGRFDP